MSETKLDNGLIDSQPRHQRRRQVIATVLTGLLAGVASFGAVTAHEHITTKLVCVMIDPDFGVRDAIDQAMSDLRQELRTNHGLPNATFSNTPEQALNRAHIFLPELFYATELCAEFRQGLPGHIEDTFAQMPLSAYAYLPSRPDVIIEDPHPII